MRFLPPNWEGLHPSHPERFAPFNSSPLSNALTNGGAAGFVAGALSLVFRRSPSPALKLAAWTTVLYGTPWLGVTYYWGHTIAKPYLATKGIQVPKQKIIDRPFTIDADNWILAGALGGVGIAASVRRPWGVSGWKRWLGSMSMGATVAHLSNAVYHYPLINSSAQVQKQQAIQRELYMADIRAFVDRRRAGQQDAVKHVDNQQGHFAMTSTSLQDMLKGVHDAVVKDAEAMADKLAGDHDIDDQDPRPHYSETSHGERLFHPQPNYHWQPGSDGVQNIEAHIQELKDQRARLTNEAAFLFHNLASKQQEFYKTPKDSPTIDQCRVSAEMLSGLHAQVYLDISRIDWCIAHAQMTKLQIEKENWLPPKPKLHSSPHHLLRLVDDFAHDNEAQRAEMDMLEEQANAAISEPGLSAFDTSTGKVVDDPYAQIKKDLLELKKAQEESDRFKEASAALKIELENEGKHD